MQHLGLQRPRGDIYWPKSTSLGQLQAAPLKIHVDHLLAHQLHIMSGTHLKVQDCRGVNSRTLGLRVTPRDDHVPSRHGAFLGDLDP